MANDAVILPRAAHIAAVRFSALGDLALAAPAVRALRAGLPEATITWITSPLGYALLQGMEGIQFEVYEKPHSLADYRRFYRSFSRRRFDAVLAMQANLRINLLYPALHAPLKIGFDRKRAREGQWLFCNRSIPFSSDHLADSFLSFAAQLGARTQQPDMSLPVSAADIAWAADELRHLPRPLLAIHPCSSKAERNWPAERYAAVIQAARARWQCGFVLTGGNSQHERDICASLRSSAGGSALDLCGRTTPKQLAAVLGAADALIAPDTAAVHLARAMDTPVVGLYAVAPPELSGPYQRLDRVVNRYPDAVRCFLGKDPERLPWNTRVHDAEAMNLITVDDVLLQLARLLEQ